MSILGAFLFTGCKVYQIDYATLPEADKQKLIEQRYNSHVRIQSGWINNPFYWDNGYYGNWNGWNGWNRFQSPAIIIKRQPNKRNYGNNNRNNTRPSRTVPNNRSNVRGSRGQVRPVVKPRKTDGVRRGRGGNNVNHTQQRNNYIRKSKAVPTKKN